MSEFRASLRVTDLDEYGLPAEPPPLPAPPQPGVGRMSRRGLVTAAGGLALGGMAALSGLLADSPVRWLAQTQSAAGQPPMYDCPSWGAREPSSPVTVLNKRPEKILVHHTATANSDQVAAADLGILARSIQNFHMDTNGWLDTGQNFTINRGGLIAEGRHRSLRTLLAGDSFVEGAHCTNQNDSSIGIENQGTYTEVQPPAALFNTLILLCAYGCRQYGLKATELYGHRDYWDTACPGDKLYSLLPTLRAQVARLLGQSPGQTPDRSTGPPTPADPSSPSSPSDPDKRALTGQSQLAAYNPPRWPLLRIADRGPAVLAAQYLMRASGIPNVPVDGQFGRAMADGVREFQRRHAMEQSGMIGGGSWPMLAVPVRAGTGGDRELAVRALLRGPSHQLVSAGGSRSARLPDTVRAATWQRLLTAATTG